MSDSPWRRDPDLAGGFHPHYPDDLQVVVHDGEPRRTQRGPEACWVRVQRLHGALRCPVGPASGQPPLRPTDVAWVERPVYAGELLNAPHHLTTARRGDTLLFVHAPGLPHPLRVTEPYLAERPGWAFTPCDACGADQSLDPPSVMARTRFPTTPPDAVHLMFTAFCPCGGTMMLALVEGAPAPAPGPTGGAARKPWWKLW